MAPEPVRPVSPGTAELDQIRWLSPMWLVPIVAIGIALALGWESWRQRGPDVTITLESAEGIAPGKTEVRYKDVKVGSVIDLQLSQDLQSVQVNARLQPEMEKHLSDSTQFWVVTPRISASGISGLDTLLSGVYIEVDPGKGGRGYKREFTGLKTPPQVHSYDVGSSFSLVAESLGSLDIGSPVYYREVKVGELTSYSLDVESNQVHINLFIEDPYDTLVTDNSNFWNVSGLGFDLGTDGFSVNIASFSAVVAGGIAFDSPQIDNRDDSQEPGSGTFHLFENRQAVVEGAFKKRFFYILRFDESVRGLKVGAPVEYRGLKVGEVERITLDTNDQSDPDIQVLITIQPERLDNSRNHTQESVDGRLKELVAQGMRAHLRTGSLLTGALFVDLAFSESEPGTFAAGLPYSQLPAAPSATRNMVAQVRNILTRFEQIPIERASASALDSLEKVNQTVRDFQEQYLGQRLSGIVDRLDSVPIEPMSEQLSRSIHSLENAMRQFDSAMGQFDSAVGALDVEETLENLELASARITPAIVAAEDTLKQMRGTLRVLEETVSPDSRLYFELMRTIENIGNAADSVDTLSEELSRYPQSLILGGGERD